MTRRVLAGLALGLATGVVAYVTHWPVLIMLAALAEPVGTLWVHAILATVVPLVVSSLIVGTASAGDTRLVGRLGRGAMLLFVALAIGSAAVALLIVPPLVARLPLDAATSESLRASAASAATPHLVVPTVRDWFVDLVPSNAIKAAAEGTMLPLIVFTMAFALALTRVPSAARQAVVRVFEGVSLAMRVLIGWVLAATPYAVFALTLALAARVGAAAAGALAFYVGLAALACAVLLVATYPVAVLGARIPLRRFARAAAPPQAVAIGSRSSLASLPALLDSAERQLAVPSSIAGFSLPLAVATFKMSSPASILVGVLFTARLYGIALTPVAVGQAAVMSVVLSFAVPGVPGGWLLIGAPIFAALGLPVQAIGMLLAVDVVPDMMRTIVNVTADLAVATILARHVPAPGESPSPGVVGALPT